MKNKFGVNYLAATIVVLASLGGWATSAQVKQVKSPMKYAKANSKMFAEGDSNDSSGWLGCVYDDSEAGALTLIRCNGSRDVLVHGGEMVTKAFSCLFTFEPSLSSQKYYVSYEMCE